MDYGYLERQQADNDRLQRDQFLNIIKKYAMPQYTSDNLDITRKYASDATGSLGDPYKTNSVGNVFGGSEFSNAAKNSYDVTNNLNVAEKNYANKFKDWGTNFQNDQNNVNYGLSNKAIYDELVNSQTGRLNDLKINNANRISTEKINKNKVNAAYDEAQLASGRLRKSQDSAAMVDFISAIATVIGSIYGGPAGGTAAGAGVKAGGTAMVKNNNW